MDPIPSPNPKLFSPPPQAKMDNEVLAYKDLAALPKDKAILDIERPDLMIYEPHFSYAMLERNEAPRSREVGGWGGHGGVWGELGGIGKNWGDMGGGIGGIWGRYWGGYGGNWGLGGG